jgi:hypothetical protein
MVNVVKSNFYHGKIDHIFIKGVKNPGCVGRIQSGQGESRVRGRIQGAQGKSGVGRDNPGCAGIIQGAWG